MKIIALELYNVRGFKILPKTSFSKSINVIIGPNNAGKSTILNSIFSLQRSVLRESDITVDNNQGSVYIYYKEYYFQITSSHRAEKIKYSLNSSMLQLIDGDGALLGELKQFASKEPENIIYPYLSKRKIARYHEVINESNVNIVNGDLTYLYPKIDRLSNPNYPGSEEYTKACKEILGFEVSTIAKGDGKRGVYFIDRNYQISLDAMGEGVGNILGLVTDLCMASEKIFLIEEPENDIHPKALKALMDLIVQKSNNNQFLFQHIPTLLQSI